MRKMIGVLKKFLGLAFYVSPLDKFLEAYDKENPKLSPSQKEEKEKYDRIMYLRDNKVHTQPKENFWSKF